VSAYNRQVLEGLPGSDDVQPGVLRGHSVTVGSYRGPPSEDCAYLLDHLCEWLTGPDFEPRKELGLASDLLRALLAHLYLAWIHPFGDGNGRTARLLEFHLLVSAGVPSPAAHLFSNHYNQTRAEYYRQLDRASRSGGDVVPFLLYGLQGLVDGLRQQLDLIRHQQVDVAWRNYVHEHFGPTASPTIVRRRNVVLDLSRREQPVPLSEIRDLSPRVATAYAQKTTKTLSRDLRYLVDAGLIALEPKGYRARRELILAFLPARVAGA
jgi:hypothetical protein